MSDATQALRRAQATEAAPDESPVDDRGLNLCPTCGEPRPTAPGDYSDLACGDCREFLFDGELG